MASGSGWTARPARGDFGWDRAAPRPLGIPHPSPSRWRCEDSGRVPSPSSARAARWASGTKPSASAPPIACRRVSACRTTRPRSPPSPISPRPACSRTGHRALASRITLDGADPRRWRPSWSAGGPRRPRPHLVELVVCMRARPPYDMLYLGKDPRVVVVPPLSGAGIRRSPRLRFLGGATIPLRAPAGRGGHHRGGRSPRLQREADATVEAARGASSKRPGPAAAWWAWACWPESHRGTTSRPQKRAARARPELLRSIQAAHGPARADVLDAVTMGVGEARAPIRASSSTARTSAEIRQRVPAPAPAPEGVRGPDPQLAAGRGRRARGLHRSRPDGPAPHRRDAVQRFRGQRIQPARQQRGQDPLPLGRLRADGGAHALGRTTPCRPVPQPEHRALVLPHPRPQDRDPVHAPRRAGVDGGRGRGPRSRPLLRAHRAYRDPRISRLG